MPTDLRKLGEELGIDLNVLARRELVSSYRRRGVLPADIPNAMAATAAKLKQENKFDDRPYLSPSGKPWSKGVISKDLAIIRKVLRETILTNDSDVFIDSFMQNEDVIVEMSRENTDDSPAARARVKQQAIREKNRMMGFTFRKGDYTEKEVRRIWRLFFGSLDRFFEHDLPDILAEAIKKSGGEVPAGLYRVFRDDFLPVVSNKAQRCMQVAGFEMAEEAEYELIEG